MLWWLTNVKLVLFFLVISRLSLAANKAERNDTIKRSFHGESLVSSYVTVTVPGFENDDLIARLITDQLETTTSTDSSAKPRFHNQVSSSLETVLNRCLDRHLTLQFLGPFLIFTGLIGLLNGPLFGVKVLLFSIQFNIVFPTFVCFVTVCWTVFILYIFCIGSNDVLIVRNGFITIQIEKDLLNFIEGIYMFRVIVFVYENRVMLLGFFPKLLMLSVVWIVPFRVVFVPHL